MATLHIEKVGRITERKRKRENKWAKEEEGLNRVQITSETIKYLIARARSVASALVVTFKSETHTNAISHLHTHTLTH